MVIVLPEFVRNFAEVMVSQHEFCEDFFLQILSTWYERQLHKIYVKNENIAISAHRASKQRQQVARDFERLEENLNLYVVRMHEKFFESKYTGKGIHRLEKRKQILQQDLTSDSESLGSSEDVGTTMAEEMFSASSQVQLPDGASFSPF